MHISIKNGLAAAAIGTAFLAGTLTTGVGAQAASTTPAIKSGVATPSVAGRAGWQGKFTYTLAAGSGGVFFHYPCATGFVPRNGGWATNAAGQAGVKIVGEGPRWDTGYNEYFWTLLWPAGAPAGVTIDFDVYCTKTPI